MSIEYKHTSNTPDEPLEISSDINRVVLRELTDRDDEAYYALVQKNAAHLQQGGLSLADMYQGPGDVASARAEAEATDGMHRFGVWKDSKLVGGLDLSPTDSSNTSEISYFVDYYRTTEKIGRQAVYNALAYLDSIEQDSVAKVKPGHTSSSKLLMGQGYRLDGNESGYAKYRRTAKVPSDRR